MQNYSDNTVLFVFHKHKSDSCFDRKPRFCYTSIDLLRAITNDKKRTTAVLHVLLNGWRKTGMEMIYYYCFTY